MTTSICIKGLLSYFGVSFKGKIGILIIGALVFMGIEPPSLVSFTQGIFTINQVGLYGLVYYSTTTFQPSYIF